MKNCGRKKKLFSWKWFLKHITLSQKKRERSDIAVFEAISVIIFTHCHTYINYYKPCWQIGGIIILLCCLYSYLRTIDNPLDVFLLILFLIIWELVIYRNEKLSSNNKNKLIFSIRDLIFWLHPVPHELLFVNFSSNTCPTYRLTYFFNGSFPNFSQN